MPYPPEGPGFGDLPHGPREDELAAFFRAVLPDDEPPAPPGFVARARASGRRVRRVRNLRIGLAACTVAAVVAGSGFAVAELHGGTGTQRTQVASQPPGGIRVGFAEGFTRLAEAVGDNLAGIRQPATVGTVGANKPVLLSVDLPPVARYKVDGPKSAGFVEITTRKGGPPPVKPGRKNCPKTAGNAGPPTPLSITDEQQAKGTSEACESGFLAPGTTVYFLTTTVNARHESHQLVVRAPSGTEVVVTVFAVETASANGRTGLTAPLTERELLELLRRGDAMAALHGMPAIPM